MKKKKKPEYSITSNVLFIIKNLWSMDKLFFPVLSMSVIAQVAAPTLAIFIPKLIIDMIGREEAINRTILMLVIYTIIIILLFVMDDVSNKYRMARQVQNRFGYQLKINTKLIETDYVNISGVKATENINKAYRTIGNDRAATQAVIPTLLRLIVSISGLIVYSIIVIRLSPLVILLLAAGAVINTFASKNANEKRHEYWDSLGQASGKTFYMRDRTVDIEYAKDIRLYGMADWILKLYKQVIKKETIIHSKIQRSVLAAFIIDGVTAFLRDGLAYVYLIYMVFNGLGMGDFVLYLAAIAGISSWMNGVASSFSRLHRHSLDICSLRGLLDLKDESNRGISTERAQNTQFPYSIEFKNVSYTYPGSSEAVLKDFNMKIRKGSRIALVGVNGAGKTTIVKLLTGLIKPDEGEILINGINMEEFNIFEYYERFTVSFQDAVILAYSVSDNISMRTDEDTDYEKLNDVLEIAGLKEKVTSLESGVRTSMTKILDEKGTELSGGEKQKLILARSLYKEAPILVLDEPTAALDPIAEAGLYKRYDEMSEGKTSIYISHRLASTQFCDEIIMIDQGSAVERGTHSSLMKAEGKYSHMFNLQSHYYKEDMDTPIVKKVQEVSI